MPEAVILSACRTAIGKFGKSLVGIPAPRLGAIAIGESVKRAKVQSKQVEEVIMGNVVSAGLGQNPARQSAIFAGIPVSVGAFTVNKVCGSGLKGVMLAAQSIKAGDNNLVVAGGMENMSNAPYLVRNLRWGIRYGDVKMVDSMINDGLWDVYNDYHMGITGEVIAKRYRITRRDADEFAYESHMRASRAIREGRFEEEMDLVEHNEAYATASIAVREALGVESKKFDVNGGAVSLGHPIGCSGARVLTTLIYALKHAGRKRGLATLCLGGGNAVSMIVER